jgi:hypothetical protein
LVYHRFRKEGVVLIGVKRFQKIVVCVYLIQIVLKAKGRKNQINGIDMVTGADIIVQQNEMSDHANRLIAGQ